MEPFAFPRTTFPLTDPFLTLISGAHSAAVIRQQPRHYLPTHEAPTAATSRRDDVYAISLGYR